MPQLVRLYCRGDGTHPAWHSLELKGTAWRRGSTIWHMVKNVVFLVEGLATVLFPR